MNPLHWEPIVSLSKKTKYNEPLALGADCFLEHRKGQTDMTKTIFVSINFTKAHTNTCTQPSYINPYQWIARERSCILVR